MVEVIPHDNVLFGVPSYFSAWYLFLFMPIEIITVKFLIKYYNSPFLSVCSPKFLLSILYSNYDNE